MPLPLSVKSLSIVLCVFATTALTEDLPRTITVSGQGSASSEPDMATVNAGVTSFAKTAKQALASNTQAMQAVMKTLKGRGISQKDIQTTGFRVYAEYTHTPSPQATTKVNRIAGYRVSNTVRVKVFELPSLGETLDALVQSGGNQISGVEFGLSDPEAVTNEARREAVADARKRAELYAEATNTQVGGVISISEQAIHSPRPVMMRAAAMERGAVPIARGEQEVTASVNIMYALE